MLFAACPEASRFTDEEAEDFLLAAETIDRIPPEGAFLGLRKAGLTPPVELAYDSYRLGRYLFRRWLDPGVKDGFVARGMQVYTEPVTRVRRHRRPADLRRAIEAYGPVMILAMFRATGGADLISDLRGAFTAAEQAEYRATVMYGKRRLHQFLTEPEPARLPTRWEQQKLVRRIHLRNVQLRAMHRSRRQLDGERSRLQGRLQDLRRQAQPELKALAAEMESVRAEGAEARRRHEATLAAAAADYGEQIARLQAEVAAAEQTYARVLALRCALLGRKGRVDA